MFLLHYVSDIKLITRWILAIDERFLRKLPSSDSSLAWKIQQKMLHSAGYRLAFHPAHVFCPLCTLPGNPRVPLQPCCLYPGELCPESHVELPGNSVMALRPPSYGFPSEPLNVTSFLPHHFQSSTVDITPAQLARNNREDINSNNGRLKVQVLKISTLGLIRGIHD